MQESVFQNFTNSTPTLSEFAICSHSLSIDIRVVVSAISGFPPKISYKIVFPIIKGAINIKLLLIINTIIKGI